jgi:uncharacterized protein with HEPN domain
LKSLDPIFAVNRKKAVTWMSLWNFQVRKKHPDIPWKIIAGMRDKLIHGYFGIRYDVVWETIELRLPSLRVAIKQILDQMDKEMEKA